MNISRIYRMCGVIGIIGIECIHILLDGLKKLQNRGYCSSGVGTIKDNQIIISKAVTDDIDTSINKLFAYKNLHKGSIIGMAHNRWVTHGEKNEVNSHPHICNENKFAVVHNGTIYNYSELKKILISEGYKFYSTTDTEIIVNLLSFHHKTIKYIPDLIKKVCSLLEGTWSLIIMCVDVPDTLFCTKNQIPLLLGQCDNYGMITSEQYGFTSDISSFIIMNDHELGIIHKSNGIDMAVTNLYTNEIINKDMNIISSFAPEAKLGNYPH
jgi:glutamine---fructose-6-phosphate transaminase (isomerizing)